MKKLIVALCAAAMLTAPAIAANCRDAKGKFIKCPVVTTATASNIVKDAKGKCHFASGPKKGQFTKCP